MEVFCPLLLIFDDLLTRVAVHVGLSESDTTCTLHLGVRRLVLLLILVVLLQLLTQTFSAGTTHFVLSLKIRAGGCIGRSWMLCGLLIN